MKIKPETATAVLELLMMGGIMPETCWAVNKCQDNKLKNCCIWLVIYLNFEDCIDFNLKREVDQAQWFFLIYLTLENERSMFLEISGNTHH
jgi:hypothetical protein